MNDVFQPVLATIEALVVEYPRVDVLNDGPDHTETRTMGRTNLPDVGLDTVAQAKGTVVEAVVPRVGIQAPDNGTDRLGQTHQIGKHHGVVDVRGRRQGSKWNAIGRDNQMILGSRLAAVGRIGSGQLATVFGSDATTVRDDIPGFGGGLWSGTHHPDQHGMNAA